MGQAALTAVNLLDVPRIVLGGEGLRASEEYFRRAIDTAVNNRPPARGVPTVSVLPSLIKDAVAAVGAASLVLHRTYAPGWHRFLGEQSGVLPAHSLGVPRS
jgi:predicted NBD/HSP70 family sugar kinase